MEEYSPLYGSEDVSIFVLLVKLIWDDISLKLNYHVWKYEKKLQGFLHLPYTEEVL